MLLAKSPMRLLAVISFRVESTIIPLEGVSLPASFCAPFRCGGQWYGE